MDYTIKRKKPNPSEIALSEGLIAPMIYLMIQYHPHLMLWNREYYLEVDETLCGKPDYLLSYIHDSEEITRKAPLVGVAKVKVGKFSEAWSQTLAEMVACQELYPEITIYGWITNGLSWEFGKLEDNIFTLQADTFSISTNPQQIAGILDWIFAQATQQIENSYAFKKICGHCGTKFMAKSSRAIYCSHKCRKKVWEGKISK